MGFGTKQLMELQDYITVLMKKHKIPGLGVGIARGEEVLFEKGFGYRDLDSKSPVTPQTLFGVASVTKSFTATALMKLQEQRKIDVHAPIRNILREFGVPGDSGDRITTHHCLSHTAGFPPLPALGWSLAANTKGDRVTGDDANGEDSKATPPPVTTYKELLKYLRTGDYRILGEPGVHYSYSNDAYGVLGAVIEAVSGSMYAQYMEQNILAPLGMRRSTFNLAEVLKDDDKTSLYYKREYEDRDAEDGDEILTSSNWQVAPAHMACGWLKSCVCDLLNYVRWHATKGRFLNLGLLGQTSLDMMTSPYGTCTRDSAYGYGLRLRDDFHGVSTVEHSGGLRGVSSQIGWIPEQEVSVVVLCNLSAAPTRKVLEAVFNIAVELPLDTPRSVYKSDPWDPDEVEALLGTFKSGEGVEIRLRDDGGKLFAQYGSRDKVYEVLRDSKNMGVITVEGEDNEIGFLRRSSGAVWALRSGGRIISRV